MIANYTPEQKKRIYGLVFASVYPMYIKKVESKGRTKAELDEVIFWLTGYDKKGLQEQINNIIKHADASFVRISIDLSKQFIDLEIVDNGKGFYPATVSKGLGLTNIRNRAEFHRGTSHVSSAPGEGCIVSVCMPLVRP